MASADDIIAKLAAQAAGNAQATAASRALEAQIKAEQSALSALGGSLDDARSKLVAMQNATSINVAEYRKLTASIKEMESAQRSAASNVGKLESARPMASQIDSMTQMRQAWAQQDADMAAWKGAATEAFGVASAAAAAYIAILVGAVGIMLELGKVAYDVIDKREDWVTLFDAIGQGKNAGAATLAQIDKLAKALPFSTSQIADWAKSLTSAGISAKELEAAVTAVASATALMGQSGGAAAESMIKQLAEGGKAASTALKGIQEGSKKSAAKLADMGLKMEDLGGKAAVAKMNADQLREAIEKALAKKGKGAIENMFGDFPVIMMKVKEGFVSLFEKLGKPMDAFMAAFGKMFGQFGKGTGPMKALQKVVTEVFGTILNYATMAIKAISAFVKENFTAKNVGSTWKDIKEAVASVLPALKALIEPIKAMLKDKSTLEGMKVVFKVIAAVVVVAAVALVAMAGAFLLVINWIGKFATGAGSATTAVRTLGAGILNSLKGLASGAASAAGGFISGLLGGIKAGAGAIIAAVAGLAKGALGAFKSALGIASPSKVMMEQGGHMATGVAEGVTQNAPKAQAATAKMVDASALKASGGKGGASGGGKIYNFSNCDFSGTSEDQVRGWMYKIAEEDALSGPEASPG